MLFHDAAGYARAGAALGITSIALPFVFVNLQSRYLLAAIGRQRVYLMGVVVGLVANAVGCVLTVGRWGVLGAAWTFVAAEVLVFLVCHPALARHVSHAQLLGKAARPALAAALMGLLVWGAHTLSLPLVAVLGVATYVVALLLLRALSREEWDVIRSVLRSFGRRTAAERNSS
jgi:O-antigen/teichoic acid export membrane protein